MKIERKAAFDGQLDRFSTPLFQIAALCLRDGERGQDVLLITSSEKRWILPKGWPMDGKSDAEAAAIEAWEEAGVTAKEVADAPITRLVTTKDVGGARPLPCQMDVYRIDVAELRDDFPEAHKRERKWVPLCKAADLVEDPALKSFLAGLWGRQTFK